MKLTTLARRTIVQLLCLACLTASGVASAGDKVKLRLDWSFGAEHAGFFVAREKGFFKEENLEVDLLPGEGSSVTVKLVGNGDAEFGYATAEQVLLAAAKGLPVRSVAVVLQQNPNALVFREGQKIQDIKTDLAGKTVGVMFKSSTGKQWEALKRRMNIDATKFKEVPADQAIVPLITANRIDVGVGFYFNEAIRLRAAGEAVNWITFTQLGMPMYSSALVTNEKLIKSNPDLVKRVTRAVMKGWMFTQKNPSEALKIFLAANPTIDPKFSELKLPEVIKLMQSDDVVQNGLGHSTENAWSSLQNDLNSMGIMDTKIDVKTAFTNEFITR
ncbi:ABC transporter substrate-binding protein [Variovorax sp. J22P271]|uniref:ABC transporter substrate-binding protein n=1 Tax=Variovorax davisae TaxID=3053515 RepID=UPI002574EF60|nr:ABC transporter substrate-binding protein [Variovorax sp. J22P271]MDM0035934.1 ABC transporter substrate-binding protein [Variovorax sp. J22P271]